MLAASQAGISDAVFAIAGSNTLALTNNIFWNNTSGTHSDVYGAGSAADQQLL